jgi:hypothetical protein
MELAVLSKLGRRRRTCAITPGYDGGARRLRGAAYRLVVLGRGPDVAVLLRFIVQNASTTVVSNWVPAWRWSW